MNSAANAYAKVAKAAPLPPRELEATLLIKAAGKLQAAHDQLESDAAPLDDALNFNRQLWTIFATSATAPENPLPLQVRENVANLAVFMLTEILTASTRPTKQALATMININRELAAGLSTPVAQPAG